MNGLCPHIIWWRHQMEAFSALLALCAGNPPITGEFPSQKPVTRSFDVFFDLRLNKRLSKQSLGWWFETPSRSLWRHCNVIDRVVQEILNSSALAFFPQVGLPIKKCPKCIKIDTVMIYIEKIYMGWNKTIPGVASLFKKSQIRN